MDMVERVARIFDPKAWELVPKTPMDEKAINHLKHVARLKARAAIEAMREPTDEQRNNYYELSHRTATFFDAHWERAIDAILMKA